jgi:hypothetical protein
VDDRLAAHHDRAPGEAGVMLAARRVDVDDLNVRARRAWQAFGRLLGPALTAAEREFAVGDRVLCGRNDRRVGGLNGDLATATAIDTDARTLTVDLGRGEQSVELPARHLDNGHLNHAYAMTAHKAQGATVDPAWVLGSGDCYLFHRAGDLGRPRVDRGRHGHGAAPLVLAAKARVPRQRRTLR